MFNEEPGLLVFHPDCGGLLLREDERVKWNTCETCGIRVSLFDRKRIINEFIRPGEWKPKYPDPRSNHIHRVK